MSFIALRIGAFQPRSSAQEAGRFTFLDAFVSRRDLNQLIHRCIDAPDTLRFAIFHGLSNNTFKRLDISDARELVGYTPEDDFVRENPATYDLHLRESIITSSQQDPRAQSGIRGAL